MEFQFFQRSRFQDKFSKRSMFSGFVVCFCRLWWWLAVLRLEVDADENEHLVDGERGGGVRGNHSIPVFLFFPRKSWLPKRGLGPRRRNGP